MIAKILELSALEAGALGFELHNNDIAELARRAIMEVEFAGGEDDVELTTDFPAAPLLVASDDGRIIRVLVNLLENAVKFSPRGGEVQLAIEPLTTRPPHLAPRHWDQVVRSSSTGAVLVRISDAGPGIPDDEKDRVFERFFQAESGKRIHRRGVGLGLTICREIVAAHQGALWVDDAPGGGSTFSLLLPWIGYTGPEESCAPRVSAPAHQGLEA
jgi:signal transduction histidine kinase